MIRVRVRVVVRVVVRVMIKVGVRVGVRDGVRGYDLVQAFATCCTMPFIVCVLPVPVWP